MVVLEVVVAVLTQDIQAMEALELQDKVTLVALVDTLPFIMVEAEAVLVVLVLALMAHPFLVLAVLV
jgi:hypothetical protein